MSRSNYVSRSNHVSRSNYIRRSNYVSRQRPHLAIPQCTASVWQPLLPRLDALAATSISNLSMAATMSVVTNLGTKLQPPAEAAQVHRDPTPKTKMDAVHSIRLCNPCVPVPAALECAFRAF